MFLESLKSEIEQNLAQQEAIKISILSNMESPITLESLMESILKLSINERLLLVEAITQSIRKETNLIAS
jgi:RNA-binding protein YhbY